MDAHVKRIIADIKSLKIQGARNVAKSAVQALNLEAETSKSRTPKALGKELAAVAELLSASRPTEPMMRNRLMQMMEFFSQGASGGKGGEMKNVQKNFARHGSDLIRKMDDDAKKLALYGAKLIPEGALVLTHCHSSTTTRVLKEANRMGKDITIVCFETRPRYQGRTTAAELAAAGLDVTLVVDGAMTLFMKKADIVIVGADSVTSRGDLINKIGTSTLAHIARMNDVSFFSAAELAKYSPMTMFGNLEKIEERDHHEIWEKAPRGVKIRNPAFEATAAKYINGYITEAGVIPPQSFFTLATEKLGIKIYE